MSPVRPDVGFELIAKLARWGFMVCVAAALLLGSTSAAHADPIASPGAVQNLESDAGTWTSETTTEIDWNDPGVSDPTSLSNTLYTVDASPTSGAPWQTIAGDPESLELSGLSDGVHQVWVWMQDAANDPNSSTAQEVAVYIDNTPPQIGAASGIDYNAGTISFPVSDVLSGVDPGSVDVQATNPDGSDDEDLGGQLDNGQIIADLPDYPDSGNQWTFAVSASDLAGNTVTTSFQVTLKPPPGGSGGAAGGGGSGGSGGSGGPPGSTAELTVAVHGHRVHGHVPTSDKAMAFTVYQVHGTRLKVLKTGKTAKSGSFNLHFGNQIAGNFEVRSGQYQATFTLKKAKKPK